MEEERGTKLMFVSRRYTIGVSRRPRFLARHFEHRCTISAASQGEPKGSCSCSGPTHPRARQRHHGPGAPGFRLHCPSGLSFFQWLVAWDRQKRLHNRERLRELKAETGGSVDIFSAHDPLELARSLR